MIARVRDTVFGAIFRVEELFFLSRWVRVLFNIERFQLVGLITAQPMPAPVKRLHGVDNRKVGGLYDQVVLNIAPPGIDRICPEIANFGQTSLRIGLQFFPHVENRRPVQRNNGRRAKANHHYRQFFRPGYISQQSHVRVHLAV